MNYFSEVSRERKSHRERGSERGAKKERESVGKEKERRVIWKNAGSLPMVGEFKQMARCHSSIVKC